MCISELYVIRKICTRQFIYAVNAIYLYKIFEKANRFNKPLYSIVSCDLFVLLRQKQTFHAPSSLFALIYHTPIFTPSVKCALDPRLQ